MKELKIYEYQAKNIDDALRMVINAFKCHTKETCLDRSVMQASGMIKAVLDENPDKYIQR